MRKKLRLKLLYAVDRDKNGNLRIRDCYANVQEVADKTAYKKQTIFNAICEKRALGGIRYMWRNDFVEVITPTKNNENGEE